jgi:Tol biopolymer transport system component
MRARQCVYHPTTKMALLPGTRLGPYEILAPLGGGGMGDVYRARDGRLGREVALKVLRDDLSIDHERLARFEQEARAASALNHPNLVTLFDFDRGGAEHPTYLTMELVDGQSLRDLLAGGPVPMRRVLQIGAQLADGLAAAHDRGIVHRDLKLENVMVTREGRVKILDFGLAKVMATTAPLDAARPAATRPGMLFGTPGYMAPEMVRGEAVDFRVDQFSLGVLLYQLLTGSRPFAGSNPFEELNAVLTADPVPLAERLDGIPEQLAWVVDRLLSKDPAERWSSTRDLARELAHLRDVVGRSGSPSRAFAEPPAPVAARGRQQRAASGRDRLVAAAAGVALLLVGLAVGWWFHAQKPNPPPRLRALTYSGSDSAPDLSPDRRVLAFASERDGRRRIWLKQLTSGAEAPLTAGVDDIPRFAPDGGSVLFARVEGSGRSLFRIAVVGGEERRVLADAWAGDWAPDGRALAFVRKLDDRTWMLGTVTADGSGERELLRIETNDMGPPAWSPDGRQIVVSNGVALSGAPSELHFVEVASGRHRRVGTGPLLGPNTAPAWLTDSQAVLMPQIDNVRAFHGAIQRVTPQGERRPLFWSLAVGSSTAVVGSGSVVFDAATVRSNLHELDLAGAASDRWLTRGHALDRQPRYSPDGSRLLFSSNRSGNLDLWELDLASGTLRRLTDDAAEDWDPAYLEGGRRVVWSSARSGNFEIWSAAADGSDARQLSRDGVDAENPTATPDGQWIVYVSLNPAPDMRGIWKMRADGSEASRLVAGDHGLPEISPDGEFVLYRTAPTPTTFGLEVARLADGARVDTFRVRGEIAPGQSRGTVHGRARWLPDGSGIAFVATSPEAAHHRETPGSRAYTASPADPTSLWVQDFDPARDTSTTLRPLAQLDLPWGVESFAFSPDGRLLTVASAEQTSNLVLADAVPGVD